VNRESSGLGKEWSGKGVDRERSGHGKKRKKAFREKGMKSVKHSLSSGIMCLIKLE